MVFFFFSSRRRHTRCSRDWSSDVCSSDLLAAHGSEAICHSKILEGHAQPGMVIIGSDSHTPHAGRVGWVAFGVGTRPIFQSWITKDGRSTGPGTGRVGGRGKKADDGSGKGFIVVAPHR